MLRVLAIFVYGWLVGVALSVLGYLSGFDAFVVLMRLTEPVFARLPLYHHVALGRVAAREYELSAGPHLPADLPADLPAAAFAREAVCTVRPHAASEGAGAGCVLAIRGGALRVYELAEAGVGGPRRRYHGSIALDRLRVRLLRADAKPRRAQTPFAARSTLVVRTRDGGPFVEGGGPPPSPPLARTPSTAGWTSRSSEPSNARGEGGPRTWPRARPAEAASNGVNSLASVSQTGRAPGPAAAGVHHRVDLHRWSSMAILFKDDREADCWFNLLRGQQEAKAWWTLARSLSAENTANMFLSRFFFQSMRREGMTVLIKKLIQRNLDKVAQTKFPRDLQGNIYIDDFIIGKHIPSIADVSEARFGAHGEVGFDMNLCYKGGDEGFTLYFRLALTYRGVRIPHIVFSVKLHHLEASLYVSVSPPPSKRFWIGCHVPPALRVEVRQGCASGRGLLHRVLGSLPDLSALATNLLKCYFFTEMVLPYLDDFSLPSLEKTPPASPLRAHGKARDFDRTRAAELSGNPAKATEAVAPELATPLAH